MNQLVTAIDIICVLSIVMSLSLLLRGWRQYMPSKATTFIFAGLLGLTLIRAGGNVLEWAGIWNFLDIIEEHIEVLEPFFWGILFYVYMQARLEKSLRSSEENLAVTLNSIGEGVIVTDIAGRIERVNPQAEKILGVCASQCYGKNIESVFTLVDTETQAKRDGLITTVIKQGAITGFAKNAVLLKSDGHELVISDSSATIYDKGGESIGVVVAFRDITDQHLIEEQLRHSEKMKAIGQLAGGIAHDFNNLCTGINNYSELLDTRLATDAKSRGYVGHIKNCANQAAELTRMLLAFARKGKLEEKPVDVHSVISEVVAILEHTVLSTITIECTFDAPFAYVSGDHSQLENAILNIALNARDAMPKGGTLTFATTQVTLDDAYCRVHKLDVLSGEFVEIVISDTGVGMSEELKEHIFEPFFTTKELDKGTGLGLASVYGSVKSHRGAIDVVSSPDKGTSFIIFLPLLSKDQK